MSDNGYPLQSGERTMLRRSLRMYINHYEQHTITADQADKIEDLKRVLAAGRLFDKLGLPPKGE